MTPPLLEHTAIAELLAQQSPYNLDQIIHNVLCIINYQQVSKDNFINHIVASEADFKANLPLLARVFKTRKQLSTLIDNFTFTCWWELCRTDWLLQLNNYNNQWNIPGFYRYVCINETYTAIWRAGCYIQSQITDNFKEAQYFKNFKNLVIGLGKITPRLFYNLHFECELCTENNHTAHAILYNILKNIDNYYMHEIADEFDSYRLNIFGITPIPSTTYTMSPELTQAIKDDFKHPASYYGIIVDSDCD